MASRPVDLLIAYRVIKILVTPFNKQPAYKMGIIEKGSRLPLVELDNMHKKEVEKSLQNLNLLNL